MTAYHRLLPMNPRIKPGALFQQKVLKAPTTCGVYQLLDKDQNILYIGKAKHLKKRLLSYLNPKHAQTAKITAMAGQIHDFKTILTPSEEAALLLEARLIHSQQPKYNTLLKDDKTYPFIALSMQHPFPRIFKFRYRKSQSEYKLFGPFSAAQNIKRNISIIQKTFLLRICTNQFFQARTRPCIEYQIGHCSAPCVGLITKHDYQKSVKQAICVLSGEIEEVVETLRKQMLSFSQKQEYEHAKTIRDRIFALQKLSQKNEMDIRRSGDYIGFSNLQDTYCVFIFRVKNGYNIHTISHLIENAESLDAVFEALITQYYIMHHIEKPEDIFISVTLNNHATLEEILQQHYGSRVKIHKTSPGRKEHDFIQVITHNATETLSSQNARIHLQEQLYLSLKETLGLSRVPDHIEAYDNSHIQSHYPVAAIISANASGFQYRRYRKFKMRTTNDDYQLLRNVIEKRFKDSSNLPEMILIDGGKGQLNAAHKMLLALNMHHIDCVAISKGKKRRSREETIHTLSKGSFKLPKESAVLHYLQKLRDEVHRFAITTHQRIRNTGLYETTLASIPGVESHTQRVILKAYHSLEELKNSSCEEIAQKTGISAHLAGKIYGYVHAKK